MATEAAPTGGRHQYCPITIFYGALVTEPIYPLASARMKKGTTNQMEAALEITNWPSGHGVSWNGREKSAKTGHTAVVSWNVDQSNRLMCGAPSTITERPQKQRRVRKGRPASCLQWMTGRRSESGHDLTVVTRPGTSPMQRQGNSGV